MARPRRYEQDRVATAVRLPASVHRRLHEAAVERDVSANLLITRAITDFLDRLAPAELVLTARPDGRAPVAPQAET